MTKNGLDIQTISTKWIDKQADPVLLLGQVTAKKGKANPSHFLKFLLATPHCTHLVLPDTKATLRKTKRVQFLSTHLEHL